MTTAATDHKPHGDASQARPTLQDAIEAAGSPVRLLWTPGVEPWTVPVMQPEFAGWSAEQQAWRTSVALFDLSFHMFDTVFEGPDATRALSQTSANDFDRFAIGQAKQFVPVAADGNIIVDGILLREAENRYILTGVPASQNWVAYHARAEGLDVEVTCDPDSSVRRDRDPVLFRFQIQGPRAGEVGERLFDEPLPATKFFHSTAATIGGHPVRVLRHGMAGQAGYEIIGDFAGHDAVREAILTAGEPADIAPVGGKAYFTNGVESGWIPTPTPAIYTDPGLADYRRELSAFSYEGKKPLSGSFYSDDITDYYVSPWELGYGRSIHLEHDFIGREALRDAKDRVRRRRVTLVLDPAGTTAALGSADGYFNGYGRYRIERNGKLVGMTFWTSRIGPLGRVLSLSLVDAEAAEPGTEVEVVWGEHPGHGVAPEADLGFPRIRAVVHGSPYDHFARTSYRAD
ncbi:aminomethyl transferase family protein [Microbacterium sp.]|uniref:aminomethyl transferase family protein n=1 Tax=Microbacterium sp. TaxID=51671 RepID=UPI003A8361DF